MSLIFFDFEVFKHDWLVVIIDPCNKEKTVIVNDKEALEEYHAKHMSNIWVGYNSRGYDQYILKAILCGFNPYEISQWIVIKKEQGWAFSDLLREISIITFDVKTNHLYGLKQLEGFMGNDIRETTVPFDIDRKLTEEEIQRTIGYCTHDVEQTLAVFQHRLVEFKSHLALINTFGLPLYNISRSQARLAGVILDASPKTFDDEWDISIPDTLHLDYYVHIADWFLNPENHAQDKHLDVMVAGVLHIFAWGGVHGARNQYIYECDKDHLLIMMDVDQLYPSIMVEYGILPRPIREPKHFKKILQKSLQLKAEGKKEEREPYKRICNITYGAMGDQYNSMYDPRNRNLVCVYGQLLLLDLIEKIEPLGEIIQSNTDGILVKIKRSDFDRLDDVAYEWEQRTRLSLSFDFYTKVIQKDVNNYVLIGEGRIVRKGAYVKDLGVLDYDLPIVNKAVTDYILYGKKPSVTIGDCNDLKEFQKIVKVSHKYRYGVWNGQRMSDTVFRVFASKRATDGPIGRVKEDGGTVEKFANTPSVCFVYNAEVNGVKIPDYLDKKWYIQLAQSRLIDFGYPQWSVQ